MHRNAESSTVTTHTNHTMIREVIKAKYKADKTIVLGLLWMYFHDCLVHVCE